MNNNSTNGSSDLVQALHLVDGKELIGPQTS